MHAYEQWIGRRYFLNLISSREFRRATEVNQDVIEWIKDHGEVYRSRARPMPSTVSMSRPCAVSSSRSTSCRWTLRGRRPHSGGRSARRRPAVLPHSTVRPPAISPSWRGRPQFWARRIPLDWSIGFRLRSMREPVAAIALSASCGPAAYAIRGVPCNDGQSR